LIACGLHQVDQIAASVFEQNGGDEVMVAREETRESFENGVYTECAEGTELREKKAISRIQINTPGFDFVEAGGTRRL
jgi:hypothetical protein